MTRRDTHLPSSHLTSSVDTRTSLIRTDVSSFLKIYFNFHICVSVGGGSGGGGIYCECRYLWSPEEGTRYF